MATQAYRNQITATNSVSKSENITGK